MHEIRKKMRGGALFLCCCCSSARRFLILLHKQLHASINICHINIYYCKIDGGVRLNILKGHDVPPSLSAVSIYGMLMSSGQRETLG